MNVAMGRDDADGVGRVECDAVLHSFLHSLLHSVLPSLGRQNKVWLSATSVGIFAGALMRRRLLFDVCPLSSTTALRDTPNSFAKNSMRRLFALPSIGAALTLIFSEPPTGNLIIFGFQTTFA